MPAVKYDPNKEYFLQFYLYSTEAIVVPALAGGSATENLLISNDAPFMAKYLTVTVLQADVIVKNWGGLIQIEDSTPNRKLFSEPVPVDAIRGNGELPYAFDPPRLFHNNSSIEITVTNNVVTATSIYVVFHGHKLFEKNPDLY